MVTSTELVAWTTTHALAVAADMHWASGEGGFGGFWEADRPELKPTIHARSTSALDFLQRFAGQNSQWSIRGQRVFDNNGDNQSMESGARAIADVLREWMSD